MAMINRGRTTGLALALTLAVSSTTVSAQEAPAASPAADAPAAESPAAASSGEPADDEAAAPAPSAGPSDADKQRALDKYNRGVEAFGQKRYKDAADLFLEADAIASSASFAYNISLAYEQLGDSATSLKWSREYLRRKPDTPDRAEVEERIRSHEKKLQDRGVQQVTVRSDPAGATVVVDDVPRGVTPWTGELTPGNHKVLIQQRGFHDNETQFFLAAERAMDVELKLLVAADVPAAAPVAPAPTAPATGTQPATPAPDSGPQGFAKVKPWTWASLGLGVGCFAAAIGFEAGRAGAESDARDATTQVEAQEHIDSAEGSQLGARIFLGIGAAATVAGGVLLTLDLMGDDEGGDGATQARAALGCSGPYCGLGIHGRW
jgi:tetratricopeptide (TPR) repeat protein